MTIFLRHIMSCFLTSALLYLVACGSSEPEEVFTVSEPTRSAVQDSAIRRLLLNGAEANLCGLLQGKLMPLPDRDAPSGAAVGLASAAGRLSVDQCQASRTNRGLAVHLAGRGWTWADEHRQGPLGSSFKVQGHLRFRATVDVTGDVDMGYSERHQVLSIWFSPKGAPMANMSILGRIPMNPSGGWSGLIGTVGQVLGGPLEDQARPIAAQFGSAMIARRLSRGITATNDLCTGQMDVILGALADGETPQRPYSTQGARWLENQRIRLRPGGMDVAGPWEVGDQGLRIDVEAESGPGLTVRLLCEDQGRQVLASYVESRPEPSVDVLQLENIASGQSATFSRSPGQCPVILLSTPLAQSREATIFRYLVQRPGERARPLLLRCSDS